LIYDSSALPDRREGLFYCRGYGERNPHQDTAGSFELLRANLALGLFSESEFLILMLAASQLPAKGSLAYSEKYTFPNNLIFHLLPVNWAKNGLF